MKKTVFSAMRPTGKLHLGHWAGALDNWLKLQEEHQCIFAIVDWHGLMGEYEQSREIPPNVIDMAVDWLACGIDPQKSVLFVQSHVPQHLELFMMLSCLTPLGWLERNPTYKEQLREITTRDLQTYAFLGYPVLQAADILLYKANAVPIGEDQLPHLELAREIARRFNHIYKTNLFGDCEALLTKTPRLMGLDNRKMSKSYNNAVNLSDAGDVLRKKVLNMVTDPERIKMSDPGHPEKCNVHSYYKVFSDAAQSQSVHEWCSRAQKGCVECKSVLNDILAKRLAPIQARREALLKDKSRIHDILSDGAKKAQELAKKTMTEVKEAVFGR